uniref:Uncharacterized protein orf111 n=1 Tax=Dictyota dichotoma TaxID=2876 RepID=Q2TUC0_DICDH|nr:hypothetical protein DidiocMp15 [Dictyota dichotoma]AAS79075.1 hypothetical protein [Dictyota dichotoma]
MRIKKIYRKKTTALLTGTKYAITNKITASNLSNETTNIVSELLFKGGSFMKRLIPVNYDNFLKILIGNKINIVCLFYQGKWYLGNYVKKKNLLKQHQTLLSLLYRLKTPIK